VSEREKKPSDLLVIVNPQERQAAQGFIDDRLKALHVTELPRLQELVQVGRAHLNGLQRMKDKLGEGGGPAARVLTKLFDAAMTGTASVVSECNRAAAANVRLLKEMKRELAGQSEDGVPKQTDDGGPTNEEIDAFLIPCTDEEEAHALQELTDRAKALESGDLRRLRDACQELVSWWESEGGQGQSLLMNQYGNVNSSQGRIAIRGVRDDFQKEVFPHLRSFFRDLNTRFQLISSGKAPSDEQEEVAVDDGGDSAEPTEAPAEEQESDAQTG
jgi:hypothetical protein